MSRKNTTRFTLNPEHPPKASKALLKKLDAMKDEDIDYSGIPELTEDFFRLAKILRPSEKRVVTMRLDEEVLDWFKAQGDGYQSHINAILRSFVETQKHS